MADQPMTDSRSTMNEALSKIELYIYYVGDDPYANEKADTISPRHSDDEWLFVMRDLNKAVTISMWIEDFRTGVYYGSFDLQDWTTERIMGFERAVLEINSIDNNEKLHFKIKGEHQGVTRTYLASFREDQMDEKSTPDMLHFSDKGTDMLRVTFMHVFGMEVQTPFDNHDVPPRELHLDHA